MSKKEHNETSTDYQYKALFDNSTIGLYRTTPDGKILLANHAMVNILGYNSFEELTQHHLKKNLFESSYPRKTYKKLMSEYGFIKGIESDWKRKDGSVLHVRESAKTIKNEQGEILYFEGSVEDITKFIEAENRIKRLNRAYAVLSNINHSIVRINDIQELYDKVCSIAIEDGKFRMAWIGVVDVINQRVNVVAKDGLINGYLDNINISLRDELSGKGPTAEAIHTSSHVICNDIENDVKMLPWRKHALDNGYLSSAVFPLIVFGKCYGALNIYVGEKNYFDVEEIELFDEVGADISFAIETIYKEEKRIQLENELVLAKDKAEEMNRLKSNFLANMSHELRTPMGGIIGFTRIIKDNYKDDDIQEMSGLILQSGSRLMETLNLILDLSRIEAGKTFDEYGEFDIIDTTKDVIEKYSKEANEKNLFIKAIFRTDSIKIVHDERLFYQSVSNLISNAIKFTATGGITVEIFEEHFQDRDYAIINVIDTGIGIPEYNLNVIWEEFRQASEGLNRSYEGIGLGLTVAKMFIDKMKGEISVESIVGKGSTFTIRIPIPIQTEIVQKDLQEQGTIAKPYILTVEDDFGSRKLVKRILSNFYNVELATNGVEALKMVKQKLYDAILMDINLGRGMNGLEVAQEIKKLPEYGKTPIIALTAYAMAGDKERFLANGCSHYISKPFSREELMELLGNVVEH